MMYDTLMDRQMDKVCRGRLFINAARSFHPVIYVFIPCLGFETGLTKHILITYVY